LAHSNVDPPAIVCFQNQCAIHVPTDTDVGAGKISLK
jgi:hypothetical protein